MANLVVLECVNERSNCYASFVIYITYTTHYIEKFKRYPGGLGREHILPMRL